MSTEQDTQATVPVTDSQSSTSTVPPPEAPLATGAAQTVVSSDVDDKKRKATETVPLEPANKAAKVAEGSTPHTGDQNEEEPTIVWPEDAVKSKEDEFTFYERVLVNDVEYKIGDCVEMWPDDSGTPGFVGTIESLLTDGNENLVECCWFYRIEETIFKNNPRHQTEAREIYLSDHVDENALEAVRKKVTVKPFSEITDMAAYIAQPDTYFYKRKYNHKAKCFVRL